MSQLDQQAGSNFCAVDILRSHVVHGKTPEADQDVSWPWHLVLHVAALVG